MSDCQLNNGKTQINRRPSVLPGSVAVLYESKNICSNLVLHHMSSWIPGRLKAPPSFPSECVQKAQSRSEIVAEHIFRSFAGFRSVRVSRPGPYFPTTITSQSKYCASSRFNWMGPWCFVSGTALEIWKLSAYGPNPTRIRAYSIVRIQVYRFHSIIVASRNQRLLASWSS